MERGHSIRNVMRRWCARWNKCGPAANSNVTWYFYISGYRHLTPKAETPNKTNAITLHLDKVTADPLVIKARRTHLISCPHICASAGSQIILSEQSSPSPSPPALLPARQPTHPTVLPSYSSVFVTIQPVKQPQSQSEYYEYTRPTTLT